MTPQCNTCGYSVEWLRSCYTSSWRLFQGSGQVTRGYYYFSPPGTPHYPDWHNVGSLNWTTDERDPPPLLGEIGQARRPYSKGGLLVGYPPAVRVGNSDCVRDGDRLPLPVVGRTLIAGVDSRCWSNVGQVPPPWPAAARWFIWYRPEDIFTVPNGDPLAFWPDATGNGFDLADDGVHFPPYALAVVPGRIVAKFGAAPAFPTVLQMSAAAPLGNSFMVWMIGTKSALLVGKGAGAQLVDDPDSPSLYTGFTPNKVLYTDTSLSKDTLVSLSGLGPRLFRWRREPRKLVLSVNKIDGDAIGVDPGGTVTVEYLAESGPPFTTAQFGWVGEVIVARGPYDPVLDALTTGYLLDKWPTIIF